MRIFLAGGSGTIGRRLVPLLLEKGYQVTAMTRSPSKVEGLRAAGAEPVTADGLDRDAVMAAVKRASPDVVIHQMTALKGFGDLRQFDQELAPTNRLRIEGTEHLLEAARVVGARRFIAQSYGGWPYARLGGPAKSEDEPLDPSPPAEMTQTLAAIRHLESAVLGAHGIDGLVLRYGAFYGPGTSIAEGVGQVAMVHDRLLPVIGDGGGIWSFVHVDDAASATAAAVERGRSGIYNVADDEPAAASVWIPELARAVGARPPRHIPVWVARILVGEVGIFLMTQIRGALNTKAKLELGWQLRYPTWRQGFQHGLAEGPGSAETDTAA